MQGKRGGLERKPSRAAIRDRYGSSRIDASAPNAAADETPSARYKSKLSEYNGDVDKAKDEVANQFNKQFQPRSFGFGVQPAGRPSAWNNLVAAPQGSPESIAQFQQQNAPPGGVASGFFNTPYGTAEVTVPGQTPVTPLPTPLAFNLSTPSPVGASALSRYMPSQSSTYTPPWRKQSQPQGFMASILEGASKWLV